MSRRGDDVRLEEGIRVDEAGRGTIGPRHRRRMDRRLDTALGLTARGGPLGTALKAVLYTLLVFVFAGPLLGVLVGAFSRIPDPTRFSLIPDEFTLDNFARATERNIWRYFLNSLLFVGGGLLLQITVSVLAAYALARKRFRGAAAVLLLMLTTMMIPEEVIAIPLSVVLGDLPPFGFDLIEFSTLAAMILPVGAWGFSILVMTELMKEVPVELEEAARVDGAGELRLLWTVILPMCRPALGVIGIFGFTMIWDQYLLPLIVTSEPHQYPLSIALRTMRGDTENIGLGVLLVGALLALLPTVVAFFAFQGQFMRGLTSGAVKG